MKQTLLLERVLDETRLAVIEDDRLCELYIRRRDSEPAAGSVWMGRVENVVPGMNAAFVDIGLDKNGFLYAGDIPGSEAMEAPRIEKLLRPGQPVMVQLDKAQSGQKGHRLTGRITLPGRRMALMPGQPQAGVSKKIDDAGERARLRDIAGRLIREDVGVIVRTAARCAEESGLRAEYAALLEQWREIERRAEYAMPPARLFDNDSLPLRCVRDMLNGSVEALWVDDPDLFAVVSRWAGILTPELSGRVRRHEGQTPLFDLYRVDAQLDKALRKYVWLDSGGSLVIEETEAMTIVDVNTGKFTGSADLEDTVFRLNCEAAEEIVRQLRLRDIGGIVIVDFIDMKSAANNAALLDRLRTLAKTDRSRLSVVGMTGLGLVELTRKRERRPLSKQLMHTCAACSGDGVTPDFETTARRAARDVWRRRRRGEENPILVRAAEPVARRLMEIGAPEGGAVYVCGTQAEPGAFEIAPADTSRLPRGTRRIEE